MTNMLASNRIPLVLAVILLTLGVGLAIPSITATEVTAQVEERDMGDLLTNLWDRVLENQSNENTSEFVFTIAFNQSIPGLGSSVTFGQGLETLRLQEAGENYFCVARLFSRTTNTDCMPYTNVTKVSYSER
jgi:hypothetical protein